MAIGDEVGGSPTQQERDSCDFHTIKCTASCCGCRRAVTCQLHGGHGWL